MRSKKKQRIVYAILILFAIVQIFPLLWLVNYSFKDNSEIYTKSSLALAENFGPENYIQAWIKGNVSKFFLNSVFVALVSVVLTLVLGCMMAYAFSRLRWKISGKVLSFVMLGMMIPIHATLIPLFILMQKFGLLNSHWGLILPYVATGLPLAVFIMTNFMRSLPHELEEAAFLDGCSVFRSFIQVILPTVKPAISTVAIFAFMNDWNEFIMASTFLQKSDLYTLPIGLTAFKGQYSTALGPMAACIVIASIPILIFYMLFSEQVEKSFAAGAGLK